MPLKHSHCFLYARYTSWTSEQNTSQFTFYRKIYILLARTALSEPQKFLYETSLKFFHQRNETTAATTCHLYICMYVPIKPLNTKVQYYCHCDVIVPTLHPSYTTENPTACKQPSPTTRLMLASALQSDARQPHNANAIQLKLIKFTIKLTTTTAAKSTITANTSQRRRHSQQMMWYEQREQVQAIVEQRSSTASVPYTNTHTRSCRNEWMSEWVITLRTMPCHGLNQPSWEYQPQSACAHLNAHPTTHTLTHTPARVDWESLSINNATTNDNDNMLQAASCHNSSHRKWRIRGCSKSGIASLGIV